MTNVSPGGSCIARSAAGGNGAVPWHAFCASSSGTPSGKSCSPGVRKDTAVRVNGCTWSISCAT
eukprot:8397172-Lingulodinium_polyedra.AAC.1